MTGEPIPVGVVGAGNMGTNHVRVYEELPQAELFAVVEPDAERARRIEEHYDVEVLESVSDLSGVRAVSIVTPNEQHLSVAEQCADSGFDLLVEKPLAPSVEGARSIVEAAGANDVVLQVGHIEQFNPALRALKEIVQNEEIIAIEAHRLGPFHEHLSDQNVVLDLMLHDLDVIDSIVDADLELLSAFGVNRRSSSVDYAVANLKYANGVLGTTTASHVTHGKVRTLDVTTRDAYIALNYQNQNISIQRRGVEQTMPVTDRVGYRTETITESPFVRTREPLKVELEHFLDRVRDRRPPDIGGERGIRAVELATEVIESIDGYR